MSWLFVPLIRAAFNMDNGRMDLAHRFLPPSWWDATVALFHIDFNQRGLQANQQPWINQQGRPYLDAMDQEALLFPPDAMHYTQHPGTQFRGASGIPDTHPVRVMLEQVGAVARQRGPNTHTAAQVQQQLLLLLQNGVIQHPDEWP